MVNKDRETNKETAEQIPYLQGKKRRYSYFSVKMKEEAG